MKTQELCTAFHYIRTYKRKLRSPLDHDADVLRRFVRSTDGYGGSCYVLQTYITFQLRISPRSGWCRIFYDTDQYLYISDVVALENSKQSTLKIKRRNI